MWNPDNVAMKLLEMSGAAIGVLRHSEVWAPPWHKAQPTSVEDILEDQLRRLVVERRDTCEELKKTHA